MKWTLCVMGVLSGFALKAQMAHHPIVQPQVLQTPVVQPDNTFNMVTGIIQDANGTRLSNCTVRIKNTRISMVTSSFGTFALMATASDTLLINLIYYPTVIIPLNSDARTVNNGRMIVSLNYRMVASNITLAPGGGGGHMMLPSPQVHPPIQIPDPSIKLAEINNFPFPPPKGYAQYVLDKRIFGRCNTLSDVNQAIINAIQQCNYDDRGYYAIPDGFALVTKVEEMEEDGSSDMDDDRFKINKGIDMHFWDWIAPHRGYFRVFAFLVTDVGFSATSQPVTQDMAEGWLQNGANRLPPAIGNKPYNQVYDCTVIVYEFTADDVNSPLLPVVPTKLSAATHLEKSNIYRYLASKQ